MHFKVWSNMTLKGKLFGPRTKRDKSDRKVYNK